MPKTAFIHPDLGIGGAERLVVDAAVGLQDLGHSVTIYTSHCDPTHCFEEVSTGLLSVTVFGDFLPTAILGKFYIFCAIVRQLYLIGRLVVSGEILKYDYFIVDQLSFCVPLLKIFGKPTSRVLFYCHFPDQLLSKKGSLLKKLYRLPFNAIEEWTTGISDKIVVNSSFTRSIFHSTFTHLGHINPAVVYPCVDVHSKSGDDDEEFVSFMKGNKYFLSINRFERLKNVELAVDAFAKMISKLPKDVPQPKLVLAGGFDARVKENVEYLRELESLCDKLGLTHFTFRGKLVLMPRSTQVIFLPSVKTSIKNSALKHAELLLYTPTFEHFGIVPVESMLKKTPVLAINRGGPLESVVHFSGSNLEDATGFNRPNDSDEWASTLFDYYTSYDEETKRKLGKNGRRRAKDLFSRENMSAAIRDELIVSRGETLDKGPLFNALKLWKLWLVGSAVAATAVALRLVN